MVNFHWTKCEPYKRARVYSCFILHILTCLGFEGKVAEVGEGAGGQGCHNTLILDDAVSLPDRLLLLGPPRHSLPGALRGTSGIVRERLFGE